MVVKWQVYVGLDPPHWTLSSDKLDNCFTNKTKALVLNRCVLDFEYVVFAVGKAGFPCESVSVKVNKC